MLAQQGREPVAVQRVLMIHNFYQIGGGEHTVFQNEVRLLREHGVTVETYTKSNADLKKKPWMLVLLPFTTLWSVSSYRAVKRIIREKNIQVVHCHNTFPLISPSVYYAAWKCGVPVVQTIHNFRFVCPNGLLYRDGQVCEECLEKGLKCAQKYGCYRKSRLQTMVAVSMLRLHRKLGTYRKLNYIFLTEFNRDKMLPLLQPQQKVFIKPNFTYTEAVRKEATKRSQFIFVGRLDENKGIEFLLRFFCTHTEWELYIFGNGAYEKNACEAAEKHPNIHMMGFQPHEMMYQYWAHSCALLFASEWYEGFPMTILESFSLGVPVITTALGNQSELVEDGITGEHFPLHDAQALEQKLEYVRDHRETYAEGLEQAASFYASEQNYQQLMKIYQELCAGQKCDIS